MGAIAGSPGQLGVLLTREVRWFFDGGVPTELREWFQDSNGRCDREHRVDVYDLEAAHQGLGVKLRDAGSFDSKMLLSAIPDVTLERGFRGRVEDWLKVSEPVGSESGHFNGGRVEVSKQILTRCYWLDDSPEGATAGCEVELASVTTAHVEAWTLCFETFGSPSLREEALINGVRGLLDDSERPLGFELGPESSCSYPRWLSGMHSGADLVGDCRS